MNPRWNVRPEGSTWGDWGPDDQLGRVNLLTPQKVLEGIAESVDRSGALHLRRAGGALTRVVAGDVTLCD